MNIITSNGLNLTGIYLFIYLFINKEGLFKKPYNNQKSKLTKKYRDFNTYGKSSLYKDLILHNFSKKRKI